MSALILTMPHAGQSVLMNTCGLLNVDKPSGVTSRDVVNQIVKLVRPSKVGHAGTLDPLATGVLVVCIGHATRLINIVQEDRKLYRGRFLLGQRSDTDDITGNLTDGGDWSQVRREDLMRIIPQFTGQIQQVPPQYSAVHVQGRRAYNLARQGHTLELDARPVDIFRLTLTDFQAPEFELEIECGSGTYIRSIGRDIGSQLGCGAVMTQLRRLAVGPFRSDDAVTPDALNVTNLQQHLQPALKIVEHFPIRTLRPAEVIAVRQGQMLSPAQETAHSPETNSVPNQVIGLESRTALMGPAGQLLGIGITDPQTGRLQPKIIFPE